MPLSALRLRVARALAAQHLAPLGECERTVGTITLRSDQRCSLERVRRTVARYGGCLLADDVGHGKTYVALAAARGATSLLVVAPAALRDMWKTALARSERSAAFVSHEALSRGLRSQVEADFVIVDESHHYRNPGTKRYQGLAALCAFAPTLLLSATPIQNAVRELTAQLALFLGARARKLTLQELLHCVVRGGAEVPGLPAAAPPRWIRIGSDEELLAHLLALPPPPRALDAGDEGALRTLSLVRAWSSSRAALAQALTRRLRRLAAFEQALEAGRAPRAAELESWSGGADAIQLGFASLLVDHSPSPAELAGLREAVSRESEALAAVRRECRRAADPDVERAAELGALRRRHPGARIVAFSEYAATVAALFERLRDTPRTAMLTARGARVVTGRLSRGAALARFAPAAHDAEPPPAHENIDLLITTDILAEGVNLQDASVVVHLDLPWNPARLVQRVGRVRRPGAHALVHCYAVHPPASANRLFCVERRLRRKIERATLIGSALTLLPPSAGGAPGAATRRRRRSAAEQRGALESLGAAWNLPFRRRPRRPITAAVASRARGWVAVLDDGECIASGDETGGAALTTLRLLDGSARPVRRAAVEAAWRELTRELALREIAPYGEVTNGGRSAVAQAGRVGDACLEHVRRAPRHDRARRAAAVAPLTALDEMALALGAERLRDAWLARRGTQDGEEWIADGRALLERAARRASAGTPRVAALILLVAPSDHRGATDTHAAQLR